MSEYEEEREQLIAFMRDEPASITFGDIITRLSVTYEYDIKDYALALKELVEENAVQMVRSKGVVLYRLNPLDQLADI